VNITAIKQQVKRRDRYSVFVDGSYAFSLSETALLEYGLASGQTLDQKRLEALKKASGEDKAYGNALRYVAMRPRSEWELRAYLARKAIAEPVQDQICKRLLAVGLLDDVSFAKSWIANRRLLKSVSKRRLMLELKQKHVSEQTIEAAMSEDETTERQALSELIEKKRSQYPDKTKLMQYLSRQGFAYDDIKHVLDVNYDI